MARSNNALRKHPAFIRAAQGAINILLQLEAKPYEKPSANGSHAASANGEGGDALNEEERRKAEKKAKKAEAKAKAAAAASADDGKKGATGAVDEIAKEKEDDDPAGEKLWSTKTPLKDLEPFLSHLERLGEDNALAQELVFEVAMRKSEWHSESTAFHVDTGSSRAFAEEYLRAVRALQRAHAISPESPILHYQIVRFALLLEASSSDSGIPAELEATLKADLEPLIPLSSVSPQAFSTDYLQKRPGSAEVILGAARAQWAISEDARATSELLLQMAKPENKPTLRDLRAAKVFLQTDVGADQTQLEAFRSAAAGVFPRATAFRSAEQNQEQQAAIAESRRKEKAAGNEDPEP